MYLQMHFSKSGFEHLSSQFSPVWELISILDKHCPSQLSIWAAGFCLLVAVHPCPDLSGPLCPHLLLPGCPRGQVGGLKGCDLTAVLTTIPEGSRGEVWGNRAQVSRTLSRGATQTCLIPQRQVVTTHVKCPLLGTPSRDSAFRVFTVGWSWTRFQTSRRKAGGQHQPSLLAGCITILNKIGVLFLKEKRGYQLGQPPLHRKCEFFI